MKRPMPMLVRHRLSPNNAPATQVNAGGTRTSSREIGHHLSDLRVVGRTAHGAQARWVVHFSPAGGFARPTDGFAQVTSMT